MKLLLDKTTRRVLTASGGTLEQQRQRDSGLSPREFVEMKTPAVARSLPQGTAESAGAPNVPEVVPQTAVNTKSDG